MGTNTIFIGIDGCKSGWVAFSWRNAVVNFHLFPSLESLLRHYQQVLQQPQDRHRLPSAAYSAPGQLIMFIDMPIGFPERAPGLRLCDVQARQRLPGRRSSVFPVPCQAAVYAVDYREAIALNRLHLGKAFPIQSWNIVPKMRELDQLMQRLKQDHPNVTCWESHPELAFAGFAGAPMRHKKTSHAGRAERLSLLQDVAATHYPVLSAALATVRTKFAKPDDVIDAFVLMLAAKTQHAWQFLPDIAQDDGSASGGKIVFAAVKHGTELKMAE